MRLQIPAEEAAAAKLTVMLAMHVTWRWHVVRRKWQPPPCELADPRLFTLL